MATVTRLKSEVENKTLPVLMDDGTISNYYFSNFIKKIEETEYQLSSNERSAAFNFIQNGLSSWIDDVLYCVPFIGDSTHLNAGIVPIIDNIDGYNMSEYTGTENYNDFLK